jgi:hypothetical protein
VRDASIALKFPSIVSRIETGFFANWTATFLVSCLVFGLAILPPEAHHHGWLSIRQEEKRTAVPQRPTDRRQSRVVGVGATTRRIASRFPS